MKLVALALLPLALGAQAQGDSMGQPLGGAVGDAVRGRAIVANRQLSLCLLCHSAPIPEERAQSDLAPPLDGVGARLSTGQLRLRLVEPQRLNPKTIMPAYYRTKGLNRVGGAWQGNPILSAQQVEDVVAYLGTLR